MPCMWNGKPVAGNKGSCPINSTWVEPQAPTPADDRNPLQQIGGWIKENPVEAASYGLMFGGPLTWAGKGAITGVKALKASGALKGRLGKLMDKAFRKEGVPANPGFTMPQGVNQTARNTASKGGVNTRTNVPTPLTGGASAATRVMKRPSALTVAGTAGAGAGMYGLNYAGKDDRLAQQQQLQQQQQQQAGTALDANTQALMDANTTKAEADRVAGLNPLERMMENMKKKGFWTDPINEKGSRTDTKLNRLGILMDYYGKDPKQRAASTSPSAQFAQSDKEYSDTQSAYASAQATLAGKSGYGKPTVKNLASSLKNKVKERFGDTIFSFGAKDDELDSIAETVALRIIDINKIAPPGTDPRDIENLAMDQIEEEGWK